jgi:maleylpyruvate isomerase
MTAIPAAPQPALEDMLGATSRYLDALDGLTDEDMRAPSLLPDWSRGHVVTHLARNADGLRNLLVWARTGVETPQYPSWEQREADIASGAGRSVTDLIRDSHEAADRFATEAAQLRAEDWEAPVRTLKSPSPFAARHVLRSRCIEVEVHHADLGSGYTAADWPESFTRMLVERVVKDRSDGPAMVLLATDTDGRWQVGAGPGPEVSGSLAALAWWLAGRGDGEGLACSAGEVPELAAWR